MPKQLKDTRESMTLDEARNLFDSIARSELKIERARAQAEVRIATIKEQTENKARTIDPDLGSKRQALTDFILAHPEHFKKPRNVRTSLGSFGFQRASKVKIVDKAACIEFVVDQDMKNCFEPAYKLLKKGIQAALEAGTKLPGAKLLKGDIAHYKIDKTLLDEAKGVE